MAENQPDGKLDNWPICFKDQLIIGNPYSNTAICTLWNRRDLLDGLPKEKFAVIGNLYSTYGINPLLRNLCANPHIRNIIICGADRVQTGDMLFNFITLGVDADYRIKETNAYIEKTFPRATLEALRKNIKLIEFRQEKDIEGLKSAISKKLNEISKEDNPYMEPIIIEESKQMTADMPAQDVAFRVQGNSISATWLKVLDNILKFGEIKNTEYGTRQKEIWDMVAVIKADEDSLPDWLPFKQAALDNYYKSFFSKEKPEGVAYTYGERIFGLLLNKGSKDAAYLDQVAFAIEKLKETPYSRRAIAVTWRHEIDTPSKSPPCLLEVAWSIKFNKLYQTATFRSHDMFEGWPLNTYALRKMQKEVAAALNIPAGDLVIVSMSAHMYENTWNRAEEIVGAHYRGEKEIFEDDPRGFFVITIENGEIVVQHRVCDGRKSSYEFHGTKAQDIYRQIVHENLFSKLDHAAYLGCTLREAEECLRTGKKYVQDEA